jgi:hypothetical protein
MRIAAFFFARYSAVMSAAGPIDAVITWVDGSDPAHQRKLREFAGEAVGAKLAAAAPTRFGDCGEIEYCVASLLRHAPWLRHILIVTDAQAPPFLRTAGAALRERVRVVDHREVFADYEQYLPSFSSRAIESMLWRIPDLSECFLYLNDDFQLLRPVAPEDFFDAGGVVLRGQWRPQRGAARGWRRVFARDRLDPQARPGNHEAQARSAALAGCGERYLQAPHVPHPMRRSVLAEYFALNPEVLEETLRHRLRAPEQVLATALAAHLELAAGSARIDNRLRGLRLKPASQWRPWLQRQLASADRDPAIAFGCVQSLDQADAATRELVLSWLRRRVGGIVDSAA